MKLRLAPVAQVYAVLLLGTMAFTIYGSWVPFEFRARPFGEAWEKFVWVWENRLYIQSRSDALANVVLGVPLGFAALGLFRFRKMGTRGDLVTALVVWPCCLLFAAAVEFSQLFFHGRTCSATDVVAQAFGAALGMWGWLVVGRRLTRPLAVTTNDERYGAVLQRVLWLYVGVVFFVQLMPMDFNTSPVALYRRLKDEAEVGVIFAPPWADQRRDQNDHWGRIQSALELISIYVPVGILIAIAPQLWLQHRLGVILFALLLPLSAEMLQFTVSRRAALNDVWVGMVGVGLGWLPARYFRRGLPWQAAMMLGQLSLVILAIIHWQPFDFSGPNTNNILWIPFAELASKHTMYFLSEGLERLLAFVPLGVLCVAMQRNGCFVFATTISSRVAVAVGFSVACVLELGQVVVASRTPGTTELLTGTLGAWLGAKVTATLLQSHDSTVKEPTAI